MRGSGRENGEKERGTVENRRRSERRNSGEQKRK